MPSGQHDTMSNAFRTIEIKASALHGRGVFATRDLNPGTVIDAGPVVPCANNDRGSFVDTYTFEISEYGCVALGWVSMCNHGDPNAEIEIDEEAWTYRLRMTRKVARGGEILIDYGQDYWADRT